ncbi:MAG: hypothetical protein KF857_01390 [Fimbriimonadaceae bacterium]|nr:hypothetical protein [Fimbriimonadaceae bacterium]
MTLLQLLAAADTNWMGQFGPIYFGNSIFAYLFIAVCMSVIASKLKAENAWLAWVPLVNVFYMTHVAKRPWWWPVLAIVPCVNLVWLFVLFPMTLASLAEERGKSGLLGCLLYVPVVNWLVLGYLAFSD